MHICRKYGKVTQIVTSNRFECKAIFATITTTQYKNACENWYYTLKEDNEREYDITEIYIDFNDSAR